MTFCTCQEELSDFIDGTHIQASANKGLAAVTRWVRLKYAAMNLKKLANWSWRDSIFRLIRAYFSTNCNRTTAFTA